MTAHRPATDLWTCRARPLGVEVVLHCSAPLLAVVEGVLSPWGCTVSREPGATPVCAIGPLASPAARAYALVAGDAVLAEALTPHQLTPAVQYWLDGEVVKNATHLVPVHAGVVVWRDVAILLPGPSGSGKTSLVAALVERGATYYSDEFAFLDSEGRVHPYPRPLGTRDAGGARPQGRPANPATVGHLPLPVRLVLGLRFEPAAGWRIEPLASSETVFLLLANTAHRVSVANGIPPALLRAAARSTAYTGTRGEAATTSEMAIRLAEGLSG